MKEYLAQSIQVTGGFQTSISTLILEKDMTSSHAALAQTNRNTGIQGFSNTAVHPAWRRCFKQPTLCPVGDHFKRMTPVIYFPTYPVSANLQHTSMRAGIG